MARPSKPWYLASRDSWCVYRNGKQITLCKGKAKRKEAYRLFLALDSQDEETTTARATGQAVVSLFLEHAKLNLKPLTHDGYKWFLDPFAKTVKHVDGNDILPRHVSAFVNAKTTWGKTTRFNAITAIKRAWAWALSEGHITLNPIAKMRRPKPERRDEMPDDREVDLFIRTASPCFKEFLTFIRETGCRPGEARMIERHHVDLDNREIRFKIGEDKTSGKTDKPRVIHLGDRAFQMILSLSTTHTSGPLFRNTQGRAWSRSAINCAVRRIRGKTMLDGRSVVYALRHQWATDALARGVPLSIVAEMMGNSPEIVARVYSHLSDKKALLMKSANTVRPAQSA